MAVLHHWNFPMNLEVTFIRSGFGEKPGNSHWMGLLINYSVGSEVIKRDSLEKFLLFILRATMFGKHIFYRMAILHLYFQRKTNASFGTSEYHALQHPEQLKKCIPICWDLTQLWILLRSYPIRKIINPWNVLRCHIHNKIMFARRGKNSCKASENPLAKYSHRMS